MPHGPEGYQKNQRRNTGNNHQPDIDCTMKYLAAMAVTALGQMLFVVTPHFRREAGYVVTPSSEYVPDYFIAANTTHRTPGFGPLLLRIKYKVCSHPSVSGCNGL